MKSKTILSLGLLALIALVAAVGIHKPAHAQFSYASQYVDVNCGSAVSGASVTFTNATPTVTNNPVLVSPLVREPLTAITNVYGLTFATFTVSTLYASADLHCRKWWS